MYSKFVVDNFDSIRDEGEHFRYNWYLCWKYNNIDRILLITSIKDFKNEKETIKVEDMSDFDGIGKHVKL